MFEKIVSAILEKLLSDYICDFDSKLNISLLSGSVILKNLHLKKYALDHLISDIPVIISTGILHELKLEIPWKNLKTKPVLCEINGLKIQLTPKKEFKWDMKIEKEKEENIKNSSLSKYEMRKELVETYQDEEEQQQQQEQLNKKKNEGGQGKEKENLKKVKKEKEKKKKKKKIPIIETLLETIVNNIKITIKNCEISYLDKINSRRNYQIWMNIKSINIFSTNEKWQPIFQQNIKPITYKLITLNNFNLAMQINQGIKKYLFEPLSCRLILTMQSLSRLIDLSKPIFSGVLEVDKIKLALNDLQYKCFLNLIDYIGTFTSFEKYRRYRPFGNNKNWWKFLINGLLHEKRKRISKKKFKQSFIDRDRYIELYKKFIGVKWNKKRKITKDETQEMKKIETKFGLNTLLMYRNMARIERDYQTEMFYTIKQQQEEEMKNKKRIFQKKIKRITTQDLFLDKKTKFELYSKFLHQVDDFDLSIGKNMKMKKEKEEEEIMVQLAMYIKLNDLNISLDTVDKPITRLNFGNFASKISLVKGGFQVDAKMSNFEILDRTNNTIFRKVVFPTHTSIKEELDLVAVKVEKKMEDIKVFVKLEQLSIILNLELMKKIVTFFVVDDIPDVQNFEVVHEIKNAANKKKKEEKEEEEKEEDKDKDKEKEEENKKIRLAIDVAVKAPLLYIPVQYDTKKTQYLLMDLGVVKFTKMPDLDHYNVDLNDLKVLIPKREIFKKEEKVDDDSEMILKQLSLGLTIEVKEKTLKFDLTPKSDVKLLVSPGKTKILMKITNQIMNFSSNPFEQSKINGLFKVKGQLTKNKMEELFVELNKPMKQLNFYSTKTRKTTYGFVGLSNGVEIVDVDGLVFNLFFLQADGRKLKLEFEGESVENKRDFVHHITLISLQVMHDKKVLQREKMIEQYKKKQHSIGIEKKEEKFLVVFQGILKNATMLIHNDKMNEICNLQLNELSLHIDNKKENVCVKLSLPIAKILIGDDEKVASLMKLNVIVVYEDVLKIKCMFSDAIVMLNKNLLMNFINFGYDMIDTYDKLEMDMIKKAYVKQDLQENEVSELETSVEVQLGKILISFQEEDIKEEVISVKMNESKMQFKNSSDIFSLNLVMSDFIVIDHCTKDSIFQSVICPVDDQTSSVLLEVLVKKFAKALTYNVFVKSEIVHLKYIHIQKFIRSNIQYLNQFLRRVYERERIRTKKSKAETKEPPTNFFKLEVNIKDIVVFIPVSHVQNEGILGIMNSMFISNTVSDDKKVILFKILSDSIDFQLLQNNECTPINIKPITFSIEADVCERELDRDLKYPDAKLLIKVPVIDCGISPVDFHLVLQTLLKNIIFGISFEMKEELNFVKFLKKLKDEILNKVSTVQIPEDFIVTSLTLILDKVNVVLKDTKMNKLLQLALNHFTMNGIVLNNENLDFKFSFPTLSIIDVMEKGENFYKELFYTKCNFEFKQSKMVEKNGNELMIDVAFDESRITITPPVVFEILKFVMESDLERFVEDLQFETDSKEKEVEEKEDEEAEEKLDTDLSLTLKLNNPTIYIIENCVKKYSRKIELSSDFCLKLKICGKEIEGSVGVHQIKGGIRYQNNVYKHVLYPISVVLELDIKMFDEKKIDLKGALTSHNERNCSISYNDIIMLIFIGKDYAKRGEKYMYLFKSKKEQIEKQFEKVKEISKGYSERAKEYMKRKKIESAKERVFIKTDLVSDNLYLELVDDSDGYKIPVINLNLIDLSLDFYSSMINNELRLEVGSKFNGFINYYNYLRNAFEPVLERSNSPFEIKVQFSNNIARVEATFNDTLNLNVTHEMLSNVIKTANNWTKNKDVLVTEDINMKPFGIRNNSGLQISFWIEDVDGKSEITHLHNRDKVEFEVSNLLKENFIWLKIEDSPIRLLVSKTKTYKVPFKSGLNSSYHVFISVELEKSQKVVNIHTGKSVKNCTTIPWNIAILMGKSSVFSEHILLPNESYYFNMEELQGHLSFVPVVDQQIFKFFGIEKELKLLDLLKDEKTKLRKQFTPTKWEKENEKKNVCLSVKMKKNDEMVVQLETPLSFVNLLYSDLTIYFYYDKEIETKNFVDKIILKEGDRIDMYSLDTSKEIFMLPYIKGFKTISRVCIVNKKKKKRSNNYITSFSLQDENKETLLMKLNFVGNEFKREIEIYCNFWVINQTGLKIKLHNASGLNKYIVPGQDLDSDKKIFYNHHNTMFISYKDSTSKRFNISALKSGNEVRCGRYFLSSFTELGPGKYNKTKICHLTPRYMMINHTGCQLFVRQTKSNEVNVFLNDENKPFFWSDDGSVLMMEFKLEDSLRFSQPFHLNRIGELLTSLRDKNNEIQPLCLHIQQVKGIIYIEFRKIEKSPYIIQNKSKFNIEFKQRKLSNDFWAQVLPGNSLSYSLTNYYGKKTLDVRVIMNKENSKMIKINLNRIGEEKCVSFNKETKVYIYVTALDISKVILITDEKKKLKIHVEKKKPIDCKVQVFCNVKQVGLSIINNIPNEFLYFSLSGLHVNFMMNDENAFVDLFIKEVQGDNQTKEALYPILAFNRKVEKRNFIELCLIANYKETDFIYIPYFSVSIQEAVVKVDLETLEEMGTFAEIILKYVEQFSDVEEKKKQILLHALSQTKVPKNDPILLKHFYFELFQLNPIKINVTFNMKRSETQETSIVSRNIAISSLQALGAGINTNIEGVVLSLNSLILQHPFISMDKLIEGIKDHYTKYVIRELYKIIGSIDLIGNPVGLFSDVGEGFYDFFFEPINGITSFEGFFKGIGKGWSGLFKHTLHGTFNTATKLSAGVGDVVSILSFDKEYMDERKKKRVKKSARTVFQGLGMGVKSTLEGVADGVTGIFTKPVQGSKKDGVKGFFTGMVKGISGVGVKPIAGLTDFVQKTTEGIKNQALSNEKVFKKRPPRVFADDGTLIPYNKKKSSARDIICNIDDEKYKNEKYVHHTKIGKDFALIISQTKIFYVQLKQKGKFRLSVLQWVHNFSDFIESKETFDKVINRGELHLKLKNPVKVTIFKKIECRVVKATTKVEKDLLIQISNKIFEQKKQFEFM